MYAHMFIYVGLILLLFLPCTVYFSLHSAVLDIGMWDHCFEEIFFLLFIRIMEIDYGYSIWYFVVAMKGTKVVDSD